MREINILFIDDENIFLEYAKQFLECPEKNIRVDPVSSAVEGLERLKNYDYDVIVSDYDMPEMNGLSFLETLRREEVTNTPFILFMEEGNENVAVNAFDLSVDRVIEKNGNLREKYGILVKMILQEVKNQEEKERLSQEKERYRHLAGIVSGLRFIVDENDRFVQYFTSEERNLFVGPSEFMGQPIKDVLPQHISESYKEVAENVRETGKSQRFEYKLEGVYFLAHLHPLRESGSLVIDIRDITERKRMEKKIRTLHTWAVSVNKAETIDLIYENTLDAMEKILGFKYAALLSKKQDLLQLEGTRGVTFLPPGIRKIPLKGAHITIHVANTGKPLLIKRLGRSNEYKSFLPMIKSVLAVPIKIEDEIFGVLTAESEQENAFDENDKRLMEILASHTAVAITKLKEKEELVSLQRIEKLRDEFLSMAAHEIKTPLTPIKTKLEMLLKGYHGKLTKEQCKELRKLEESVNRLDRLVEDFRRISKLRTNQVSIKKEENQLKKTVEKAIEKYKTAIKEAGITLDKDIPHSISAVYDEDRIIQVIGNLIENAIDYTDDRIWLKVWEQNKKVYLSVWDNGPGIPEEAQEKIFEPFYRVETPRDRENRRYGGTGLGLSICKRILDSHGGRIKVDSSPNEGSTFTVILPNKKEEN